GGDQLWHHIPDVATANVMGVDWNALPMYGELPGPAGDELPSVTAPVGQPSGVSVTQPTSGDLMPALSTTSMHPIHPSATGTPIPSPGPGVTAPSVAGPGSTNQENEARALLFAESTQGADDGSSNWSQRVRELYAFQYLTYVGGFTAEGAAGVIGNLLQE